MKYLIFCRNYYTITKIKFVKGKEMRTIKGLTALLLMVLMFGITASAEVNIIVDGKALSADIPPFVEDGTTYLSVHSIGDMLGAQDVVWNNDERSVTIRMDGAEMKLVIGSEIAYIDGEAIAGSVAPVIRNERTYLPVRFVAETLGAQVGWQPETKTVTISFGLVEDETGLYWLARIVQVEAGNELYEGKLAVANVILNRVKSPKYPDTIYDVIFQPNQFPPAANGMLNNITPNDDCYAAAAEAMSGVNNIGECVSFCAASQTETSWVAQNMTFYARVGNHCFYY